MESSMERRPAAGINAELIEGARAIAVLYQR